MLRILTTAPVLLILLSASRLNSGPVDREVFAMGTTLRIHIEGSQGTRASEAALEEVARIEEACSTWRPDSSWSRMNAAGGQPVKMAPEWIRLLQVSLEWSQKTDGAFDPVLMALLKAWGTRTGGRIPGLEERAAAKRASGRTLLEVDEAKGFVRLRSPLAGVEEGAFLKGYALEAAMRKARDEGAASGWMDFGGQIAAWGGPVLTEIADPVLRQKPRIALELRAASLSTSGCSERGRHILDPHTGYPCEAWGAVSVVSTSAYDADVLSTALYVMGPKDGLIWARQHEVAAVFLTNDGGARSSPAFEALRPTLMAGELR